MGESFGLYIHIPFCKQKCLYCDFFSGKGSDSDYDSYTRALLERISYWGGQTDRAVTSVYFGGGTPSVLGAERLSALLSRIKSRFIVTPDAEITAEINPDTGKAIDFELMKKAGFNRISVGLQSAVEKELSALGRIHKVDDAKETVERARAAELDNISLDLMLGIPFQTEESMKKSVDFCVGCGVKHISAYMLKIEEGTPFYAMRENLEIADDDLQAELYLSAVGYLAEKGFYQYEISNFSKKGYESRHNLCYWNCDEYLGIGPAAHSFFKGERFCCERSMESFLKNELTLLGAGGGEDEYIMLRLRLSEGLVYADYKKRFGKPFPREKLKIIAKYSNAGLMEADEKGCRFTKKGFLLSNPIISELV